MASKALLLGINKYKSVTPLRGCENDVARMQKMLKEIYEFGDDNIKIMLNQDVTKAKVLPALSWLFRDLKDGDRAVLHFSGHGSVVPTHDADETDGVDEIVCLYNMNFDDDSTYLRDKELRAWTKKKPTGVTLVVVLDNCHSGSGTRMLLAPPEGARSTDRPFVVDIDTSSMARRMSSRGVDAMGMTAAVNPNSRDAIRNRYLPPPPHIEELIARARTRHTIRAAVIVPDMNHLLLAACQKDQTAADAFIEQDYNGAFTYYLCDAIRNGGVKDKSSELENRVSKVIAANHFEQKPQFEGPDLSEPIFGKSPKNAQPTGSMPSAPVGGSQQSVEVGGNLASIVELLKQQNRILESLIGGGSGSRISGRAAGQKVLVYVHGICKHVSGFSDSWWDSLSSFAPSIQPGTLGQSRREVVWSDLVNERALTQTRAADNRDLARELRDELEDRYERALEAVPEGRSAAARDLPRLPLVDCVDDFATYMTNDSVRQAIIDRFTAVVRPLMAAGTDVEVISHSWGTVVAYEGLCELESAGLPGTVRNWFTVGAALSIGAVKVSLRPSNRDGHKPAQVSQWINLNARGDIVGGRMQGKPYAVDVERLRLDPVGCGSLLGLVNPSCAHGSYFVNDNLAVNRDIFGSRIG